MDSNIIESCALLLAVLVAPSPRPSSMCVVLANCLCLLSFSVTTSIRFYTHNSSTNNDRHSYATFFGAVRQAAQNPLNKLPAMATLPSDICIEIFRLLAIREAHDGFQQPLLLTKLQPELASLLHPAHYADVLAGYHRADIPITVGNLAAFNALYRPYKWVHGIILIFEGQSFVGSGFKLKYRNDLERIALDVLRCDKLEDCGSLTKALLDASRRGASIVYGEERNATVGRVSVLVNPTAHIERDIIREIQRLLGCEGKVSNIGPELKRIVWIGGDGGAVAMWKYAMEQLGF